MITPSKEEMWVDLVERVFATDSDWLSAARRLHKGHDLIFVEKTTQDSQTLEYENRTKRAIWAACLKCAEQSSDHVDDVANRLIKAHKIIFGGNNDHQ